VTTIEGAGVSLERLRWHIQIGGIPRGIDLVPAAVGNSVAVELDGRPLGRLPKPTPQRPWRDAAFEVQGEAVLIGLTWHFPVMRTDVFVGGRSVRDGRQVDAVRAAAPAALSNYEVWLGGVYRTPPFGSRPHPPRAWPVVVAAAIAMWVLAIAWSPFPDPLRLPAAAVLAISGVVLILSMLSSMLAVGQRVHEALLTRPSLGDWRVALWLGAFCGYVLVVFVAVWLVLTLASA
jgi:hypothetical protein